jgi:ribosomal protein RSM22 (predicted rRNA methylase)
MKIAIPIAELANRDALPAARPLRVIDLGAGCGAMSLGLIESLVGIGAKVALSIMAIDRDAAALGIAAAAVRDLALVRGIDVAFTPRTDDATGAKLAGCDLVVMGTLLNELPVASRQTLVERALAAIGDDGAVILIEPALRETSRALHELRDAILTRGTGHVFAPCTRAGAPCPSLADPSDWCHEDRTIKLPPRTAELARLTHLRDDGMKFSYLVLRRQPLSVVEGPGAYRIVSPPRSPKGKHEVTGCGEVGWVPLRLLRRHRTDANRDLERAGRGDVVVVSTTPGPERVEVVADTKVERHEPAKPRR